MYFWGDQGLGADFAGAFLEQQNRSSPFEAGAASRTRQFPLKGKLELEKAMETKDLFEHKHFLRTFFHVGMPMIYRLDSFSFP